MARFSDSEATLSDVQQLQQQLQQHIYLRETIQRIRRVLAANDVHDVAVQALMDFFQADWIFLLEHGPHSWQPVNPDIHPWSVERTTALMAYLELESVAVRLEQPLPVAMTSQSVQQVPVDQRWLTEFCGSWLFVPIPLPPIQAPSQPPIQRLRLVDGPWGLVAIGCQDETHIWSLVQQEQAKLLVDEIAIALDHSQLYETLKQENHELKALALTDSLTGLANRRHFDTYFDTEWHRSAREQQPLTLILCDIDYFKRYNDRYGHPMGDICLAKVSDVLTACIRRPADLVARYGGEEFAVVLPNTDTEGGHRLAKAIQAHLAKANIPHETSNVAEAVTLTMGIATVIPDHQLDAQDLLQAADLALYHAKQQGRDRIYVHAHYYVHND